MTPQWTGTGGRTLVVGPSWLGDCVMALPALQRYVSEAGGGAVDVVAKPAVASVWEMSEGVSSVIPLQPGWAGMCGASRQIGNGGYEHAIVLPNSWRAGLLPFLGRVPHRRGAPGHGRGWMLNDVVRALPEGHQALECAALFGVSGEALPAPQLCTSDSELEPLRRRLGIPEGVRYLVVVPGAARGPAKRWPVERFAAAATALHDAFGIRSVACGTAGERELCEMLKVVPGAINAAGATSLRELAVLLGGADAVLCNDSGGMHLAAAVGTPVVALFGLTDPSRTGPLGEGHCLVVAEDVTHDRRIARDDEAARLALASVSTDRVVEALMGVCGERGE